jgi:hypothetical protein
MRADRRSDMTKLIDAYRDGANAPSFVCVCVRARGCGWVVQLGCLFALRWSYCILWNVVCRDMHKTPEFCYAPPTSTQDHSPFLCGVTVGWLRSPTGVSVASLARREICCRRCDEAGHSCLSVCLFVCRCVVSFSGKQAKILR